MEKRKLYAPAPAPLRASFGVTGASSSSNKEPKLMADATSNALDVGGGRVSDAVSSFSTTYPSSITPSQFSLVADKRGSSNNSARVLHEPSLVRTPSPAVVSAAVAEAAARIPMSNRRSQHEPRAVFDASVYSSGNPMLSTLSSTPAMSASATATAAVGSLTSNNNLGSITTITTTTTTNNNNNIIINNNNTPIDTGVGFDDEVPRQTVPLPLPFPTPPPPVPPQSQSQQSQSKPQKQPLHRSPFSSQIRPLAVRASPPTSAPSSSSLSSGINQHYPHQRRYNRQYGSGDDNTMISVPVLSTASSGSQRVLVSAAVRRGDGTLSNTLDTVGMKPRMEQARVVRHTPGSIMATVVQQRSNHMVVQERRRGGEEEEEEKGIMGQHLVRATEGDGCAAAAITTTTLTETQQQQPRPQPLQSGLVNTRLLTHAETGEWAESVAAAAQQEADLAREEAIAAATAVSSPMRPSRNDGGGGGGGGDGSSDASPLPRYVLAAKRYTAAGRAHQAGRRAAKAEAALPPSRQRQLRRQRRHNERERELNRSAPPPAADHTEEDTRRHRRQRFTPASAATGGASQPMIPGKGFMPQEVLDVPPDTKGPSAAAVADALAGSVAALKQNSAGPDEEHEEGVLAAVTASPSSSFSAASGDKYPTDPETARERAKTRLLAKLDAAAANAERRQQAIRRREKQRHAARDQRRITAAAATTLKQRQQQQQQRRQQETVSRRVRTASPRKTVRVPIASESASTLAHTLEHHRMLLWCYLNARAEATLEEQERLAIKQLHDVWCHVEMEARQLSRLRERLHATEHNAQLDATLRVLERGLGALQEDMPRLEHNHNALASTLAATTHRMPAIGVYAGENAVSTLASVLASVQTRQLELLGTTQEAEPLARKLREAITGLAATAAEEITQLEAVCSDLNRLTTLGTHEQSLAIQNARATEA